MKTITALFFFALSVTFALLVPDKLIAAGERYRANQKAENAVRHYATTRAAKPGASVALKECADQATLSGKVRRKVYEVVYTIGDTSVTQKASVTIHVRKGAEKVVQLAAWPNKEGGMDIIPL